MVDIDIIILQSLGVGIVSKVVITSLVTNSTCVAKILSVDRSFIVEVRSFLSSFKFEVLMLFLSAFFKRTLARSWCIYFVPSG